MRRHLITSGKIILAAFLLLVLYRLGQKIRQPEMLFQIAHCLFLVTLVTWSVYAARHVLAPHPAEEGPVISSNTTPSKAYAIGSALVMIAFLLVADSWTLQNKPALTMLPIPSFNGQFAQALLAGVIFTALFWTVHLILKRVVPGHDPWILPQVAVLCGVGLVFLYRLGPDIAALRSEAGFQFLFKKQLMSLGISLLVFISAACFFTERRLERLTRKRYVYVLLAIILITVTAVFGTEYHGRRLALNLGIMNFQTVEFVKLLALLFMVGYFRFEMHFLEPGKGPMSLPRARYMTPYITMWVLTLLPIFMQKDLGPTALIFALFMVVFYLGTGSASSVLVGLALMIAVGCITYFAGFPGMVKTRIDMWLDPFHYSQNLSEAHWAVSSGGLFGSGTGRGLGYHIPVVQSDFNFAAIAEEWGLLGAAAVLSIFGLLVGRIFLIARKTNQAYKQMLLAGIGTLWMVQTFIIVGGNLGILPLTGITLPFISYGGSSLLVNFLSLGIVLRLSAVKISSE